MAVEGRGPQHILIESRGLSAGLQWDVSKKYFPGNVFQIAPAREVANNK
jgi:hypothetical protein